MFVGFKICCQMVTVIHVLVMKLLFYLPWQELILMY